MTNPSLRARRKARGQCPDCGRKSLLTSLCKTCQEKRYAYRRANPEIVKRSKKKQWLKVKRKVFDHYGPCECCGESELVFLTIDHPNDDGAEHRKRIGSGSRFYSWILKNDFPDDLRSLCHNCNQGRRINGGMCPHESNP